MNEFLQSLDITFRRDPVNHRPRINKPDSIKDVEQKRAGTYFYLDTENDSDDEGGMPAPSAGGHGGHGGHGGKTKGKKKVKKKKTT